MVLLAEKAIKLQVPSKRSISQSKFKVGDKVYLTNRAPKDIRSQIQARARTIVEIAYSPEKQCVYYYLGSNHKSQSLPWFRGYMLRKERIGHRLAKPKRKYTRKADKTSDGQLRASQAPFKRKLAGYEE